MIDGQLLSQGGFSYVYLVQDTSTSELYALKKIRCPFGQESVSLALKEVEAYTLFNPHPNIITSVDYSVASANDRSDPGSKTVYILLPYYRRGNLQDAINANLVNHTKFPEKRLMILFLGVARALKAMHQYKVKGAPGGASAQKRARGVKQAGAEADQDAIRRAKQKRRDAEVERDQGEIEQEPLMVGEVTKSQEGVGEGELRAYAHRDIKPGKIPQYASVGFGVNRSRQHYDCRRRENPRTDGSGLLSPVTNTNHVTISCAGRSGYRCRTLDDAVPSPRIV